jgi:hypothetical protein
MPPSQRKPKWTGDCRRGAGDRVPIIMPCLADAYPGFDGAVAGLCCNAWDAGHCGWVGHLAPLDTLGLASGAPLKRGPGLRVPSFDKSQIQILSCFLLA